MSDLIARLAKQASKHPERVMLVDGERCITLAQLWQKVCALSVLLSNSGVRHGDRIALIGSNSPEWVQVYLAVMAVGAVPVPLNPELRSRDLVALVNHAGASFVFADVQPKQAEALMAQLPDVAWMVKGSSASANCISLADIDDEPVAPAFGTLTGLGCILYTSGTTGAPKGVMLSHDSILQNALDVSDYLKLTPQDVSLAILPFYYSFGNSILVTHLLSGSRLVFGASLMFPEKLMQIVEKESVTGLSGVPTLFQLLLQRDLLSDSRWKSLRYIAQAGGALSPLVADQINEALPWCEIFVMYGQTEATARICYLPPEHFHSKRGSVGWPLPDTCIQIRDELGRAVANNIVGQVWVRGPGLMQGYWQNTVFTDRVLVNGWLNTGDMGEIDKRGFLYIRGRRSDMLKVSGQRLHPQEVESVICELPEIAECAVDGIDDAVVGQMPRAFVVLKLNESLAERDVLRHCRMQLAGWKVPRQVEIISALPKTSSGKIQRHRLAQVASNNKEKPNSKEGYA